MENTVLIDLTYLAASVLFILGIRGLTHPRTAVRGNLLGATGMLLAVVATLADNQVFGSGTFGLGVILAGIVLGAAIGANPKAVESYRGGDAKSLNFLMGQVMKATRGKANPRMVEELIAAHLTG